MFVAFRLAERRNKLLGRNGSFQPAAAPDMAAGALDLRKKYKTVVMHNDLAMTRYSPSCTKVGAFLEKGTPAISHLV